MCGKGFTTEASLKNHQLNVHDEKTSSCEDCGRTFIGRKTFSNHMDTHKKYTCKSCQIDIPMNSRGSHKSYFTLL